MNRLLVIGILLAVLLVTAAPAHAQEADFTYQRLVTVAGELVKFALRILGFIGVILIVWYGLRMVISRGDATKFSEARKGLLYALGGLVIVFGVWTIIATVQRAVQSVGN